MSNEKNARWSPLSNSTKCKTANADIEHIRTNESNLLDMLSRHDTFHKDEFFEEYSRIQQSIPDEWFIDLQTVDRSKEFDELPTLSNLTCRARHKIWIDVPRTFMAFTMTNNLYPASYVSLLSEPESLGHLLAVLCRTLCVSSALLGGRYCQGMSFLAASYILYINVLVFATNNSVQQEALVAASYHFLVLVQHGLGDMYVKEIALAEYIADFEYYLQSPYVANETNGLTIALLNEKIYNKLNKLHHHLNLHGLDVQFFVIQWLGSGYTLNISAELLIFLQDIVLYSNNSKHTEEPMMRLGISLLYAIADEMLHLADFESLYAFLKKRILELSPEEIAPVFFMLDLKKKQHLTTAAQDTSITSTCSSCSVS